MLSLGNAFEDEEVAAFDRRVQQGLDGAGDGLHADLRVLELAVAVLQEQLHLVAVVEEVLGAAHLDEEVVRVDARAELDLLHLAGGLLVLVLLGLLVEVLAVLHEFAHRRDRRRGDLDEVDAFLAGELEGAGGRHDAEHLALGIDHADLRRADVHVALRPLVLLAEIPALLVGRTRRFGSVIGAIGRSH